MRKRDEKERWEREVRERGEREGWERGVRERGERVRVWEYEIVRKCEKVLESTRKYEKEWERDRGSEKESFGTIYELKLANCTKLDDC